MSSFSKFLLLFAIIICMLWSLELPGVFSTEGDLVWLSSVMALLICWSQCVILIFGLIKESEPYLVGNHCVSPQLLLVEMIIINLQRLILTRILLRIKQWQKQVCLFGLLYLFTGFDCFNIYFNGEFGQLCLSITFHGDNSAPSQGCKMVFLFCCHCVLFRFIRRTFMLWIIHHYQLCNLSIGTCLNEN